MAISNKMKVRGDGPNRRSLPSYQLLGHLEPSVMARAQQLCATITACSCGSEQYPLSKDHPLKTEFGEDYLHHLLQHPATDGLDWRDYTVSADPLVDALQAALGGMLFYRARLSKLPSRGTVPWHIDTDTSVTCRLQFMIQGTSVWSIRRDGTEIEQRLNVGVIWFCNSGFSHQIVNDGLFDRWVLIIDCDYSEIEKAFAPLVLT